jgi:hypothetical protein
MKGPGNPEFGCEVTTNRTWILPNDSSYGEVNNRLSLIIKQPNVLQYGRKMKHN